MTKGALYHHFKSKRKLFEAVYRSIGAKMAERIQAASAAAHSPWDKLTQRCDAYLEACSDPTWHRVLRVDGPAVLGLETWPGIDREHGMDRLLPFLRQLSETGVIRVPSLDAFAWQLTGAMNEATFWVAQHSDPGQTLHQSKSMLTIVLESVKV